MREPSRNLFDLASDLAGPPESGSIGAWFFGVLFAGPLSLYGFICVVTRHAWFLNTRLKGLPPPQDGLFRQWTGRPAIALGLIFIGVGLFAHFHWFWSNHHTLSRYYEIGKAASLLLLVAAVAWWIIETIW